MKGIERYVIEYSGENEDGSAALAIIDDSGTELRILQMLKNEDARHAHKAITDMIKGGNDDT